MRPRWRTEPVRERPYACPHMPRLQVESESLFTNAYLGSALEERATRMRAEIEETPESQLLQADEAEWAAALARRYAMPIPVLRPDEVSMDEPEEIGFNVAGWPDRYIRDDSQPLYVPGYRVIVRIPFDGPRTPFFLRPSSFQTSFPQAAVAQRELLHVVEYPHDAEPNIRGSTDELIRKLTDYLGFVRSDVEPFNARLEAEAARTISARRERLMTNRERLEKTGIPIRRREGDLRRIEDVIIRRPAPELPVRDDRRLPLEPILSDEVFEHILGLIRGVGRTMEQTPRAYADLDEERRRDLFLPTLNSHYRGQATAEAFNVAGKTDIIVKFEDQNLFIAECKFWEGQQSFTDAIDQLFRYASWRDTKLALIVFIRERGLTGIVKKAKQTLEAHPQFVRLKPAADEAELRAVVRWPGDEERLADLNVFLFHTPIPQPRKKTG